MKRVNFVSFFLILCSIILPQDKIADKQLMLGVYSISNNESVIHTINALGEVWHYDAGTFLAGGIYNSNLTTIGQVNLDAFDWPGFNFNWFAAAPNWSLGLYKLTNSKDPNAYIYIDSRDYNYGTAVYNPDIHIFFDNKDKCYKNKQNLNVIPNGSVLRVWQLLGHSPNQTGLLNYWDNVLSIVNKDDHPRLIWGPYSSNSLSIVNYNIYRKYGTSNWQLYASVSSNILEYVDESVQLILPGGQAGVTVQYKITATDNTNFETSFSNICAVNVKGAEIEKRKIKQNSNKTEICLTQNYPNPFNPSTTINYSILETSLISLKVYDVLGREVAQLINELKSPGNYSVCFNGENLPSGNYFYSLNINGKSFTRKMHLLK